jgi:putative membrane protein
MKKMALVLCMVGLPLIALAASNSPDESFYKKAAEAGLSEVDLGNLAQQKSSDQQVKDFGAMMVKDHSAANEKLQSLASSKNISLPTKPSIAQMATKAKLDVLSGHTFDKSYVKSQVKAHQETIALLNKEINSGKDADAKAFAQSILPTVRSHLKAARALESQMKGASASQ